MSDSEPRPASKPDRSLDPGSEETALRGRELKTLLALAEGRPLEPDQLALADRVQRDPQTRQAVDRQSRVAAALRSGGPVLPPDVATRVRAQNQRLSRRRVRWLTAPRWSARLAGAAALAASAAVITLVLVNGPSTRSHARLTATQVAAVWTRPVVGAPVAADPAHPAQLNVSFHGIVYPNFHDREGWHPVALRYDTIGGLRIATVFYETGARRAAYAVVPTTAVRVPARASHLRVARLSLTEFRTGDRWIVTFEKNGSTCVLTAAAPRERQWLIQLATWNGGRSRRQSFDPASPARTQAFAPGF